MSKKLFIGNCDFGVDETALKELIEGKGFQTSSVQIVRDKFTDRSRGFGFAELANPDDLSKAIEALNGVELLGRALNVNEAREQKPRVGGGNGFFGKPYSKGSQRNEHRKRNW